MTGRVLRGLSFVFIVGATMAFVACGAGSSASSSTGTGTSTSTSLSSGTTVSSYTGSCIVNGLCENYSFKVYTTAATSTFSVTGSINAWSSQSVANWCRGAQVSNYINTGTSLSFTSPDTQCAVMNGTVSPVNCSGLYYCQFDYTESGSTAHGAVNTSTMVLTSH
jgi:hypothetical protein